MRVQIRPVNKGLIDFGDWAMDGARTAIALPVIFAACDEGYFRKHALGFCKSALKSGHHVHIAVSPRPGEGLSYRAHTLASVLLSTFLQRFSDDEKRRLTIEFVADVRAQKPMDDTECIVFYQSLRFFLLPELLNRYQRPIVVLDIDSLVNQPIPSVNDGEVGLFMRLEEDKGSTEFERLGMKILGAMVYADPKAIHFFRNVVLFLDKHIRLYYVDQRALYETYLAHRDVRTFDIAEKGWLDWKFSPSSQVWTAKGKRKRRNLTYVAKRLKFEGRGALASAMILAGYYLGIIRT
ncbi:hypothetical protein Oant_1492 [Brucella anthropi ATCC 49188]|uniref:Glycosyltransferase family 8 protein n=2 Tax=Brucella anthropi TaxID=529 RepID=A6WZ05_BRUA4|nr:hypothetical protein Oant_1492 [Brucella anthropi ATCC 49188]